MEKKCRQHDNGERKRKDCEEKIMEHSLNRSMKKRKKLIK